jgi:hypothetical protein
MPAAAASREATALAGGVSARSFEFFWHPHPDARATAAITVAARPPEERREPLGFMGCAHANPGESVFIRGIPGKNAAVVATRRKA